MTLDQALAELQNPDPRVHLCAIRWLRVIGGPQAVAALVAALDHPSADVALGDPDPQPHLTMAELVAQARQLLAQEER
jgi:hypothetical protein